jgi:hypothetical protein
MTAESEAVAASDDHMIRYCTADYMKRMNDKQECIEHLAYVASPHSTVAQLSQACDALNERFSVDDARRLCTELSRVHAAFWPGLMDAAPQER